MATVPITVAVEGRCDAAVAKRLLKSLGLEQGPVYELSKQRLDVRLSGYNKAAVWQPWLVLRDLDSDAPCAGAVVRKLLPQPSRYMHFRLAVKEVESWLLADAERIASFLAIPRDLVPREPDALPTPKKTLVELAACSRSGDIRKGMVPRPGLSVVVGPEYSERVVEFAGGLWRPLIAARYSPSLARCVRSLQRL
jgi:hypothetical protein